MILKTEDFTMIEIGDRKIVVKGIGKMLYQYGFPISMSVAYLKEKSIEVSFLHIADELLKHGWLPKTVLSRLSEEIQDDISGNSKHISIDEIEEFLAASYEDQREMIFKYLFGSKETALEWARKSL